MMEQCKEKLSMEYAKKCNADLLLATDPDCDRVGIAVKNKAGEYELLSGNQTGMLLLKNNHQLRHPAIMPPKREQFFKEIKKGRNYNAVIARIYPKICLKQKIKNMIFVFRNSKKMS